LLVESGRPAGVARTTARSPRVAGTNVDSGEIFGNWLYAGTQTTLPVLYELYGAAARRHFGGTLAGKLVVGGGLDGDGGAQPLAAALHGAAFLGIDSDAEHIKRCVKTGYCEVMVNNIDEALRMLKNAVRRGKGASIGLIGNRDELFPELAQCGVVPDLLTDSKFALSGTAKTQAMRELEKLGTHVIDSAKAHDYLQPLFDGGWRLTVWMALSGEPSDIAGLDRMALGMFPRDEYVQRWLAIAGKYVRFQGLPARVAWIKQHDLGQFALAANGLVARREISAPILFGCRYAPGTGPAAGENGSCWTFAVGTGTASAQAAVADGTAEAAERLASWTGI
jgi:urocanate hydratase